MLVLVARARFRQKKLGAVKNQKPRSVEKIPPVVKIPPPLLEKIGKTGVAGNFKSQKIRNPPSSTAMGENHSEEEGVS